MSIEQRIMEQVMEQCGKDVTVEYVEVEKANGCVRKGYRLMEVGSTLAPMIYFDERDSEDEIVEHTVRAYSNSLKEFPDEELILSQFTKENVLAKVYPVFVNIERSKGMLEQAVNCHYLEDIAITYRIDIDMGNGSGSAVITNKHLESLEITKEELCDSAVNNIQGKAMIIPMSEVVGEGAGIPLFIVTGEHRQYGASMILDKSVTEKLKKAGETFVIPSSIHEVILVPASDDKNDVKFLIDMIKRINATEVQPEDFLSDNLFRFNGEAFEKVEV